VVLRITADHGGRLVNCGLLEFPRACWPAALAKLGAGLDTCSEAGQ